MTFLELAQRRYSCRNYQPIPVEEEKLMQLLESFRVAPSAANKQPWQLIVVRLPENKAKVIEAYPRNWIETAPLLIIVCADHQLSWKRADNKDFADVDISIATDHLILQATELGLGTCWVCNFNNDIIKKNFNIPENLEPIAIVPVGYPADHSEPGRHESKRLHLCEFVNWENF